MFGVASMPVLHRCFGHGAFAEGGPRLTAFLLADGPVAQEFGVAWRALQQMVAGSGVTGPLDDAVAFAGASRGDSRHLQRAITAQLEQVFRDRLHSDIAALPLSSQRRAAWFAAGRGSQQLVVSRPTHDFDCTRPEFLEMITAYFGLESPAVRPYAVQGLHIPCSKTAGAGRLCDAYGLELGLATLPGGTHTACHDACGGELFRILAESGIQVDLQPSHIFSTAMPAWLLVRNFGRPPAIIPDAAIPIDLAAGGGAARRAHGPIAADAGASL